jgi:hypothetical protein
MTDITAERHCTICDKPASDKDETMTVDGMFFHTACLVKEIDDQLQSGEFAH